MDRLKARITRAGMIALCLALSQSVLAAPKAPARSGMPPRAPSIEQYVRSDGSIDLERLRSTGYQGPLNLGGMVTSVPKNGSAPRFFKASARPRSTETITSAQWLPTFTPPGVGIGNVQALATYGGDLIVGGYFGQGSTPLGTAIVTGVAAWDGTAWKALGAGLGGGVNALTVCGSLLIAAGTFTHDGAGSGTLNYIAAWNGSGWSALGSGLTGGYPVTLAAIGTTLYVGGSFSNAGGSSIPYIAKWDGASWSSVGGGLGAAVNALAVFGGDLYAGGSFSGLKISTSGTGTWSLLANGPNAG